MMCARRVSLAVLGSLAVCTASTISSADIIRFTFRGEVTGIEGSLPPPPEITIGTPYEFTYVFDTETTDTDPDPQGGAYEGSIRRSRLNINGYGFETRSGAIHILNDGFAGDSYQGAVQDPIRRAAINLTSLGGGALSSDELPEDLTLADFQLRDFTLDINIGPAFTRVLGGVRELERIEITCACDWNFDGTQNSQDLFDFLSDFFSQNADYNNDGFTNSADFFDFLVCFFAPCP
ncbi:MAG: hypothetical protein H7210_08850 [Pyrinomonadaceae bacterium]|nr:hypothetical protein [Phycisphaerales bacterium]